MSLAQSTDVDFEIEKEVWNVYDLADGTRLRIRAILVKLIRLPTSKIGESNYNGAFQNLMNSSVHPRNKGPAGRAYTDQELASFPKEEVNFTPEYEDWNIYKLPDGTRIKVKLVVSSIFKVKQQGVYNAFGEPIYMVNSTAVLAPVQKMP
jgi:hypothetical protein